jgi:hypothetical protein
MKENEDTKKQNLENNIISTRNKKISIEWEKEKLNYNKNEEFIEKKNKSTNDLIKYIRESIIGDNEVFIGPFGAKKVLFELIKDYIL